MSSITLMSLSSSNTNILEYERDRFYYRCWRSNITNETKVIIFSCNICENLRTLLVNLQSRVHVVSVREISIGLGLVEDVWKA